MLMLEMLKWWYGKGWRLMFVQVGQRLRNLGAAFSIGTLLRTLFAPWRRIISYPGTGLDAHFRAMLDNLISRMVGFVVRVFVLVAVAALAILQLLIGLLQVVAWPLVPLVAVVAILKGLAVI